MLFKDLLRELREKGGLTQAGLAEKSGIPPWEHPKLRTGAPDSELAGSGQDGEVDWGFYRGVLGL